MEINVSQEKGKASVSVIKIIGDLDASSYLDLVNAAQKLYDGGTRDLLLDLTDLAFISSAGLASLHIITKMFRKGIDHEHDSDQRSHVKLLNPSSDVDKVLDTVGFKQFFEVFTDLNAAVQSF